jgi:hypothetical protein
MWQHILYLRMRCFSAGSGLAIASSQSTPYNDMCTILIRDFSKEQHELPEDDKHCAIETCKSILSVSV